MLRRSASSSTRRSRSAGTKSSGCCSAPFVGTLLVNTTTLVAVATVACTILGVAVAWAVERTDLPGRRVWAVLAALPITVPAFVTSYSWVSITPARPGLLGRGR